jgi:hypothetical protein
VTSKARRALLRTFVKDGATGSVSELARRSHLRRSTVERELGRMEAFGLVTTEHVGRDKLVRPNLDSASARTLRRLLSGAESPAEERDIAVVRAALDHYGGTAGAAAGVDASEIPPPEVTLSRALRLAHDDPAIARSIPPVLWRHRRELDVAELVTLARRNGEQRTLGFFLELTDQLSGQTFFAAADRGLDDKRVRRMRRFFSSDDDRDLSVDTTPELARKWRFLMSMSLETFALEFRKGLQPGIALPTGEPVPEHVLRLLKSYDVGELRWEDPDSRYAIVREILQRGSPEAREWLGHVLTRNEIRTLIREYRGAGFNEPERVRLREEYGLTIGDVPVRPFIGFGWKG